ncbi:MAG: 4-hydroxy-2-oxovalerate aldolase [Alphaproteobacteria bacterium]|nr:4-hydroxy-2-oxovalerate aldolase [Alphaproteobacteria bacterium]MBU2270011.1 4-hydroxy-2-oxovalerate aldolase [Alphaproteobacteria bacterium]MBU2417854.1 4-hydroxy-2-oxovalerate aldolase [Alphaproteobacteria bacterium]
MTDNKHILISDPSLRDGNHAVQHRITADQVAAYCARAEAAGVPIVEVGHGNGVGASSLQLGEAAATDHDLLSAARSALRTSQLGIHVIPGFATIDKDLKPALDLGVDVFRIASHCTEADVTERFISFARSNGKTAYGVLMMSHMASPQTLVEEALKMQAYGAETLVIMDSAGAYLPEDVRVRISALVDRLSIPVGFHAHNNLGSAISNSVAAVEVGASMLDGCSRGFGAGAGNAQLEVLIAVLHKMGYETGIDLYGVLDLANFAEKELMSGVPTISSTSIVSGLSGVFSGFLRPVQRIADEQGLDPRDIFFELGKRGIVAGQEDMIIEVAQALKEARNAA